MSEATRRASRTPRGQDGVPSKNLIRIFSRIEERRCVGRRILAAGCSGGANRRGIHHHVQTNPGRRAHQLACRLFYRAQCVNVQFTQQSVQHNDDGRDGGGSAGWRAVGRVGWGPIASSRTVADRDRRGLHVPVFARRRISGGAFEGESIITSKLILCAALVSLLAACSTPFDASTSRRPTTATTMGGTGTMPFGGPTGASGGGPN
jgi:hypothetical protein